METKDITQEESFLLIGKIMLAPNVADFNMFVVFTVLSGAQPPISRAIYYSLDAISAKEKITRKVAQAQKLDAQKMECVEQIISEARKANNQRNEFAHSIVANDNETGVLRMTRFKMADWEAGTEKLTHEYLLEKLRLAQAASDATFFTLIRLFELFQGGPLSESAANTMAPQAEARSRNDQEPPPARHDQTPGSLP